MGVEPGDYVVYRIASAQQSWSDGCFWPAGEGPDLEEDRSSLYASGTMILFAGEEGSYYLDLGNSTLQGELGDSDAGESYEFAGKSVDVQWTQAAGTGNKLTTTVTTSVDMTTDGALVTGELVVKASYACSGACGDLPPSCTIKTEFIGTEVEDVQLEHAVAAGMGEVHAPVHDASSITATWCISCADALQTQQQELQFDLCPGSAYPYQAVIDCACYQCDFECGESLCSYTSGVASQECAQCMAQACSSESLTCLEDDGISDETPGDPIES